MAALDLNLVRSVAKKIPYVEEVSWKSSEKILSYVNTRTSHRIIIYCQKGTVDCTVNHRRHGRIQTVSRHVTYRNLVDLLKNPPLMENQKNATGQKRPREDVNDGEAEFDDDVPTRKSSKHVTKKKNLIEDSAHRLDEAIGTGLEEESPIENAEERGNHTFWKLRHSKSFPTSATNVACFAQAHGGYVAVFDNGTCVWQGIPATVIDVIATQRNRNIAYVALGEHGQYYIRMRDNEHFFAGSAEFERSIRSSESPARLVAFGDANSYFVLFEDGKRDTRALLPRTALKILSDRPLHSVWIGTNLVHNANGYFISYQGVTGCTLQTYAGLPSEVVGWMEKRQKQSKPAQIKQLVSDGDFFIVRY
eukprot:gene18808-21402_t